MKLAKAAAGTRLLHKLVVAQLLSLTGRLSLTVHSSPNVAHILSQTNPIHTFTLYL
jgi:hypothetical protein